MRPRWLVGPQKIKLGTSVYPIFTRTPFQIAMASATLNEVSNGRVGFIGLGVGYKARIEQYFGVKIEKRMDRMRESIEIIRGLLSGEQFSYNGKIFSFEEFPPLLPNKLHLPILIGTSASKMLRLAGRLADGVVLNSIGTGQYFEYAISEIKEGAESSGRDAEELEIAASMIVSAADTKEDAVEAARPDVLFYLLYPELDPVIAKTTYVKDVDKIRTLVELGARSEALKLVTDEMVDDLAIAGTADECREKVLNLKDQGITLPILRVSVQPFGESERKHVFLRTLKALSTICNA